MNEFGRGFSLRVRVIFYSARSPVVAWIFISRRRSYDRFAGS